MSEFTPKQIEELKTWARSEPWVRLKNFKHLGDLPPERSDWWHAFGLALESAHRDWDKRRNDQ